MSHQQVDLGELDESDNYLIRVNVPMNPKLKEEWVRFAKSRNQTLSAMVRDAVKELMKKEQGVTPPQSEIMLKLNNLEKIYAQKSKEQEELLKVISQRAQSELEEEKIEEIKGKILDILEYSPKGLHYKILAEKCRIKEETLLKLVGVLQKSEILEFKTNKVGEIKWKSTL
jgi:hypothetical protein